MGRLIEFILAVLLLLSVSILLIICFFLSAIDTHSSGLFTQKRIGRFGQAFTVYKIRSMHFQSGRISRFGKWLRKSKIDEFPQLFNIIKGDMSFVGPRPDVSGYADNLVGSDRLLLTVRPGLTGLASLKYRNEEALLAKQSNPTQFNYLVIWPDKVKLNNWYVKNRSIKMDIELVFFTVLPVEFDADDYIHSKKNINSF